MPDVDDLEGDIRAAMEQVSNGPAATDVSPDPSPEPAAQPEPTSEGERARDEQGRFAKDAKAAKDAAVPTVKDAPKVAQPKAVAPKTDAAVAPAQHNAVAQPIAPPSNWKGAAKVKWDLLPEPVRKEISEDYTRLSQTEARLQRLDATIGPDRAQALAATYGTVEQGIQSLLSISDMATKNPTGFILWFAQQRGVNLAQMAGQPQAAQQAPQQASDPVMQKVSALEAMLNGFVQQQHGAQTQGLQSEIDRFSSDPSHPYFNDVRPDMAALIQAGRAKDLQQAYDMAIWAHPDIRSSLIENQAREKSSQQSATAQQARNASVSVSGSPAGSKVPSDEPDETLEQTLRRAQARSLSA